MRVAGPIAYSASLADALRLCEAVRRSGLLKAAELPPAGNGELRVESIEWVERELGATLPDEVLALAAINHPVAAVASGVRGLDGIYNVTEKTPEIDPEEFPGSWIIFSTVYSEPFSELLEGAHGSSS